MVAMFFVLQNWQGRGTIVTLNLTIYVIKCKFKTRGLFARYLTDLANAILHVHIRMGYSRASVFFHMSS